MRQKIVIGSIIAVALLLCIGFTPIALADRQEVQSTNSDLMGVAIYVYVDYYPLKVPFSAWVVIIDNDGFAFRFGKTSFISGQAYFYRLMEGHTFTVIIFLLRSSVYITTQETLTKDNNMWVFPLIP